VDFVQKNIGWVIAAVVSGVMFLLPTITKLLSRTKEVGAAAAVHLINRRDALIVDVREPGEFNTGRIPNSRNVTLDKIAEGAKGLEKYKSKPILVVCQTGARSAQAVRSLEKQGFTEVVALAGGLNAWQQAQMPVEKDA
jgi:rhodanese-related sulfurtransferase